MNKCINDWCDNEPLPGKKECGVCHGQFARFRKRESEAHRDSSDSKARWRAEMNGGDSSESDQSDDLEEEIKRITTSKKKDANDKRLKAEHSRLAEFAALVDERERFRATIGSAPVPPLVRRELISGLREGAFVAGFSDFHPEELVVPGWGTKGNAYCLEIAELRLRRFFEAIIWQVRFKRQAFALRDVILWLGGDLMTGYLHEDNVQTSQLSPTEVVLWLKPLLVEYIKILKNELELETLTVVCSHGNHGRTSKKPMRARGAQNSFEWLLYQDLAWYFNEHPEDGLRIHTTAEGHQFIEAYDRILHFHHGDEVAFQGGVGGVMIPINKATAQWDKVLTAHIHHFGHYHQYIQTGNVTMNGSGIGYNQFGMSVKATPEPAQQFSYVLDAKRGKCEMTPLWLEDRQGEDLIRRKRGWAPWGAFDHPLAIRKK